MRSLSAATTALVLIDLQIGILSRPLQPRSAEDVLEASNRIARRFRELGGAVVLVTVDWSRGFVDALSQPVDQPMPRTEAGPSGDFASLVPALDVDVGDIRIVKRQWGAFYGTELDLQLRRRGIDTLVIAGVATNLGVESTARAAWEHGYAVVIPEDATSTFGDTMQQFAFSAIFPRIANVTTSDAVVANLQP